MIPDADMLPGRLMFKAPLLPLTVGRASVCAPPFARPSDLAVLHYHGGVAHGGG